MKELVVLSGKGGTGKTSFTIHIDVISEETGKKKAEGYTTFVTIDEQSRPEAHGIRLDETDREEELKWRREAEAFFSGK